MAQILKVEDLRVYYKSVFGEFKAVDGVSFEVNDNEIFGVAGESGCGKSTAVEGILKLVRPPGHIESGKVIFEGTNLPELDEESLRRIRWKRLSYIPQGSMNSLNPVIKIKEQMLDAITTHADLSEEDAERLIFSSLEGLGLPAEVPGMYPHELSGGMKQRVIIAMAVALRPSLIVADEPITALDVVSQRVVLQSIGELRDKFKVSVVFVAHQMAAHAQIDDRLAIMYAGKIVEIGSVRDVFRDPLHPYTQGLIDAIPSLEKEHIKSIRGLAPSPLDWPSGCRFHPRCPCAKPTCSAQEPTLVETSHGRYVACHHLNGGEK